jgi:hypothetical protein
LNPTPRLRSYSSGRRGGNNGYIRLDGEAVTEKDMETVIALYNRFDYFNKLWKAPDDPTLVVYRVEARGYDYMKPGEWASIKIDAE